MKIVCLVLLYFLPAALWQTARPTKNPRSHNFEACQAGKLDCDISQLTPDERNKISLLVARANYELCAAYRSTCDPAMLSPEQAKLVGGLRAERNYQECMSGAAECDPLT